MTARLVRTEIEVPGTPEEVWAAIATGPGIACWFVPAEVDERVGGEIVTHHGPYGDSKGVVTAWEPPRRFAYEEADWAEGARVEGPLVGGVVERAVDQMVLLRDGDGIVEIYAHPGDGRTHLAVRAYRYGEDAAAVAAREEPAWRAWMDEHVSAAV
jgi:uncharacterized protein YndB with AHSA1/START domain